MFSHALLLKERGVSVDIICPTFNEGKVGYEAIQGLNVYRFYAGQLNSNIKRASLFSKLISVSKSLWDGFSAASKLLKKKQYDIVHNHWLIPVAPGVALACFLRRIPCISQARGSDVSLGLTNFFGRLLTRLTIACSMQTWFVSEALKNEACIKLGKNNINGKILNSGVDISFFSPRPSTDSNNKIRIGYCSDYSYDKGVDILVKALCNMEPLAGYFEFISAGDGVDAFYFDELRDHNIAWKNVGRLSPNQVPDFINSVDIIVLPSRHEGCPRILMESIACGVPVVASRVGGIPEIVAVNHTGVLIDLDAHDLFLALSRIIDEPCFYQQLKRGCSEHRHKFDVSFVIDSYVESYQSIGSGCKVSLRGR